MLPLCIMFHTSKNVPIVLLILAEYPISFSIYLRISIISFSMPHLNLFLQNYFYRAVLKLRFKHLCEMKKLASILTFKKICNTILKIAYAFDNFGAKRIS